MKLNPERNRNRFALRVHVHTDVQGMCKRISRQGAYVIALVILQSKTFRFSMFDHAPRDVGAAVS